MLLEKHKHQNGQNGQNRLNQAIVKGGVFIAVAVDDIRRAQHDREFGQLRRLNGNTKHIRPAVGAVGVVLGEKRGDDHQNYRHDIQRRFAVAQGAVVDARDAQHGRKSHHGDHKLGADIVVDILVFAVVSAGITGRKQHDQPEHQRDRQRGDKAPGYRPAVLFGQGDLQQHTQDVAHRAVCQQTKHLPQQGEGALVLRFHGLSAPFGGMYAGAPRQTMQMYKRPSATPMAPIRAKKPSILTSFQPRSSKAWWMGVMRKMRLPWVALK